MSQMISQIGQMISQVDETGLAIAWTPGGDTARALVTVLAVGRLTRLITADEFPFSIKLRMWWDRVTHDGPWSKLVHCHWCASPYVAAVVLAAGLLSEFHWVWWTICGWLAVSYIAAIVVERDEKDPR
jgi:hypothetical protein